MKITVRFLFFLGVLFSFFACNPYVDKGVRKNDLSKDVEITTTLGRIVLRLSDETPLHRNNFIRLVNEGFYNHVLFHRVISGFVIQAGDPMSKRAKSDQLLGDSDLNYSIPLELSSKLFHRRGALNAARKSDDENPERFSSASQFTIVQGTVFDDDELFSAEQRANNYLAYNRVIHKPENKKLFEKLYRLVSLKGNLDSIKTISDYFNRMARIEMTQTKNPYVIPKNHREVYKTFGGAPHLDMSYTVFGEVVSGMTVVDKIASVETNKDDRPLHDIRIISARMISRKRYKTND